jgi:hypothetical protein
LELNIIIFNQTEVPVNVKFKMLKILVFIKIIDSGHQSQGPMLCPKGLRWKKGAFHDISMRGMLLLISVKRV